MKFAFAPPSQAAVAISGSDAFFPVRRIFCVGRNYADHVKEMGGTADKEPPVFFTKPADAVVASGANIAYALSTENLHYEIEMVIAIGAGGSNIAEAKALDHVFGYAVGCDLTRRDRQVEAKKAGAPWDVAKAFDQSAPIGAIAPVASAGHVSAGRIWCSVNGAVRQDSDIADMIWTPVEIVSHLSRVFALAPGDLIFTGTPAGVGALKAGDEFEGGVGALPSLSFRIVAR